MTGKNFHDLFNYNRSVAETYQSVIKETSLFAPSRVDIDSQRTHLRNVVDFPLILTFHVGGGHFSAF